VRRRRRLGIHGAVTRLLLTRTHPAPLCHGLAGRVERQPFDTSGGFFGSEFDSMYASLSEVILAGGAQLL
jgi:hypothetical protein